MSVSKGSHTITATREHFANKTVRFDTAHLNNIKTVYVIMQASDEAGRSYLANSIDEQRLREKASGDEFNDDTVSITQRYPFTTQLPYEVPAFTIDYDVQGDKSVLFKITLHIYGDASGTPGYDTQVAQNKNAALDYLKKQGAKVSSLKIAYTEDDRPPLVNELPFIDQMWRIDAGVSQKRQGPNTTALYVKYWSDQGKQSAQDWLRFKGYDPDKMDIEYIKAASSF